MPRPRLLFVSYAHEDCEWMERLQREFEAIAQPDLAKAFWCDKRLVPADDWEKEICEALAKSSVAVLLVSQHFHESSFIRNVELPQALKAHKLGRLQITWLRIDGVDYRLAVYARLQAATDPNPPLDQLPNAERDDRIQQVAHNLLGILSGESRQLKQDLSRRRRHVLISIAIILLLVAPIGWNSLQSAPKGSSAELLRLIHEPNWLAYEPRDFHPDRDDNVSAGDITRELEAIRRAGFTGIVTFGSRRDLARIPALAKQFDFAVIMGVWNPRDGDELRAALEQQQFVDAYCVGHNCLSKGLCTEGELNQAIRWLRRQTGKPVSTSQMAKLYEPTEPRLNAMGDFLFPDIHLDYDGSDLRTEVEVTLQQISRLAELSRQYDRPLIVKMLTYPVQLDKNTAPDLERQTAYFTGVLKGVRDPLKGTRVPIGVALATAFDDEWKAGGEFFDWDPYTGLFNENFETRPVVKQWMILRQ